jgi:hypothetical protein
MQLYFQQKYNYFNTSTALLARREIKILFVIILLSLYRFILEWQDKDRFHKAMG